MYESLFYLARSFLFVGEKGKGEGVLAFKYEEAIDKGGHIVGMV